MTVMRCPLSFSLAHISRAQLRRRAGPRYIFAISVARTAPALDARPHQAHALYTDRRLLRRRRHRRCPHRRGIKNIMYARARVSPYRDLPTVRAAVPTTLYVAVVGAPLYIPRGRCFFFSWSASSGRTTHYTARCTSERTNNTRAHHTSPLTRSLRSSSVPPYSARLQSSTVYPSTGPSSSYKTYLLYTPNDAIPLCDNQLHHHHHHSGDRLAIKKKKITNLYRFDFFFFRMKNGKSN